MKKENRNLNLKRNTTKSNSTLMSIMDSVASMINHCIKKKGKLMLQDSCIKIEA